MEILVKNTRYLFSTLLNTTIGEFENTIPDSSKYITTQDRNKLTAENLLTKLNQANLVRETNIDHKLARFNEEDLVF